MNKTQLEDALKNSSTPSDAYSLEGGLPNEAYCLDKEDGKWIVYYSERGSRTSLKSFDSEEDACKHFAKLLGLSV